MISYEIRAKGGRAAAKVVKEKHLKKYLKNPNMCLNCGKDILPQINQRLSDVKKKQFCNKSCSAQFNNLARRKNKPKRESKENVIKLLYRTKGELFSNRSNWQSARSSIQKNARRIFMKSSIKKECFICGYEKHIEICHKKSVSEFSDDTLIGEINNIDNLVGLCPNHHWEYDKGLLIL